MSENPDNGGYIGLGPQSKQKDSKGNDMVLPSRYLIPTTGMLRFIERGVIIEGTEVPERVRILQQYQWSSTEGDHGWYDVPLVIE